MMIATIIGCLILIFTKSVLAFYFVSFIIGISNAGTRILRITYLFSHVPNNIIGRVGSAFNCMSIVIRTLLISIFTLKFFSEGDTIKWGYLIGVILLTIALIPLIRNYKKLISLKKTY